MGKPNQTEHVKRKRHTTEEIIRKLRKGEESLASGKAIEDVCKQLEISQQTWFRWRKEYAGAGPDMVRRYKDLEKENARLKKLVAEQALDMSILKEVAEGKW